MNRKKIMFFLPTLNGGGAERVTVNIIKILDKQKFDIVLVLNKREGVYLDLIPQEVQVYVLESSKTIFSIVKLKKIIVDLAPDIVYSTLYRTHIALYFTLLFSKKNRKVIMRMPNSPKLVLENGELSWSNKFLLDLALKRATLVLAQTPEMKKEIAHYHKINEEKIEVLLNPLDTKSIDSSLLDISNPFSREHINLVASGRLTYQKGFDILVLAFQKVYAEDNRYRLYILGIDGEGKQKEYERVAESLGVKEFIHFLGFQKNPYPYYFFSDLFVLSSRWEGLPNTVLENLYLGKKVVATKCIPYMETLIDEGENGYLVEVEDAESLALGIINASTLSKESLKLTTSVSGQFDKVFNL